MGYKITIDGSAATGKGTLAKAISKELGILNIDSGMLYRTVGLYVLRNNIDPLDLNKIEEVLGNINIRLEMVNGELRPYLNDEDVSLNIRNEQVAEVTSKVAKIRCVRDYVLKIQRKVSNNKDVVMEGRDIGSVVFPDAELKIFLTADVEERAKRRYDELINKGKKVTLEEVRNQILNRDREDASRKESPLIKTEDMIEIDTTKLTIEQVIQKVKELIKEKGLGCF